jgi:hypothetical protein
MPTPTSPLSLRRACALVAVLAVSLASSFTLAGTAEAARPSASALIATATATMKTAPVIKVSGTVSGMKVQGFYVAHRQSSEVSLSGTLKGSTIQVSMIEIGNQNWMKANQAGWQLFSLGLAPQSTISKLSPTTWYVSPGTTTIDLGSSLCATTSSSSTTCTPKGLKLVGSRSSKVVITAMSPKETITLTPVRGKFLPTSIEASGTNRVTEHFSYPAHAPTITAPAGAQPFPTAQ